MIRLVSRRHSTDVICTHVLIAKKFVYDKRYHFRYVIDTKVYSMQLVRPSSRLFSLPEYTQRSLYKQRFECNINN